MKRILVVCLMVCLSSSANAALIGLTTGSTIERTALVNTLTSMGHTVTATIDGNLDLIIAGPGNGTPDFPGVPYLQISDHGADHITNSWLSHPQGTPVNITLHGSHPILTGLATSWTTLGFWNYDASSNYIGWVTSIPGLADADVLGNIYNEVLAATATDIYIGWNVYGPDASSNDLLLLRNSIEFLTTGSVGIPLNTTPIPTMSAYGLILTVLGLLLVASRRLRTSARRR